MRRPARLLLAALLALGTGCPVPLRTACPRCTELELRRPPPLPEGTERVYVLVPGVLGYGWEWDGVQSVLARVPGAAVLVLDWSPWGSLAVAGERVREGLQRLLQRAPASVREVTVIGHSVGGLVLSLAAAELQVPPSRRVSAVVVGAPFAGMHATLFDYRDALRSPSPLAVGGTFSRWPRPAPGVELLVYPTGWPNDPVMKPRMGHDPGRLDAVPPGAKLRSLPPRMDHNLALAWVVERIAPAAATSPPSAAVPRASARPPTRAAQ